MTAVLVEHNLPLVLEVADMIHVLNMGSVIASGTPEVIRDDPDVAESYLGRRHADRTTGENGAMTSSLADASEARESRPAPLLDVQSISAGYGDLIAVRDVSVQVSAGELVAIIGRNGAGKSTTLLAIAGMLKARSGAIVLDGTDVTSWPVVRRITLGLSCVAEGRQVFRRRTVTENLALGTYPLRLSRP